MYAGITVGKVRNVGLKEDGKLKAAVKLGIYEGVTIRRDAKFVINQSGLLGDRYVDVIPQSTTAEPLKPGDVVVGASSVDLTEAIRSVVDVLQAAGSTIERVDQAIRRVDETVLSTQSLRHIVAAMENIEATTSNAVAVTEDLRSVIADSRGSVTNALAKLAAASETMDTASKRVDTLVASNQDDIRAAVKNFAASAERLNTILARLENGEGTAGRILADPTLHDEIVRLVQNWRRYGLLYKEPAKPDEKRGKTPVPARPAQ
jgi:phospholipid/cholesterol/gamma-HCH transport system substrate-binding protein